jgi:hypothetical protein
VGDPAGESGVLGGGTGWASPFLGSEGRVRKELQGNFYIPGVYRAEARVA